MYSLGYDIGSSAIKAALVDRNTGKKVAVAKYPDSEMDILALQPGWAEQQPDLWWNALCEATKLLLQESKIDAAQIESIGIAYQMHGLVLIDKNQEVLRPSIIWCDSRAVSIGEKALTELGEEYCFGHLLNGPGNFTASKLRWIKEHEPDVFDKIDKLLLPGDFIAMKLTGEVNTTVSGLSEGIFWDFANHVPAERLLSHYDIPRDMIPELVDTFGIQGKLHPAAAAQLGLKVGTPLTYRAGDQPNNALSLGVFNPGEIAATGGTSGVVYGVSDQITADKQSRVNAFAHVNHYKNKTRIGQLLCINGAGSQYAWINKQMNADNLSYTQMEASLSQIPIGSEGLSILPFGNGAERMLNNQQSGAHFSNVQFNTHTAVHFYRAAIEGIAFSFVYGIQAMADLGIRPAIMRVGNDNLFQSATFANTICNLLDCQIEMFDTTGAVGAAQASRVGIGDFENPEEAIYKSNCVKVYQSDGTNDAYLEAYNKWKSSLNKIFSQTN